jgi:hypothetical protein
MEQAAAYADAAVMRWQKATGRQAMLESTGETFESVTANRLAGSEDAQ